MSKIIHTLQSPDKSEFDKRVNLFLRLGCDLLERSYEVITNDDGVVYYSQVIVFNNNCEVEFYENGELKSFVKYNKIGKNGLSVKCNSNGMFEVESFKNGERDIVTNEDGSKYEGEFKNGKYDGLGSLKFYQQSYGALYVSESYEGEFKDGKLNGKGVSTRFIDPETLTSFYENPTSHYAPTYENRYEGEFKDGKMHGWGIASFAGDESDSYYEGEYKSGQIQKGNYCSGGYEYIGGFKNGKKHGEGQISEYGFLFYAGSFKDGEFDGRGRFFIHDGTQYEGEFVKGKFFGNGTITLDGKIEKVDLYKVGVALDIDSSEINHYSSLDGLPF